MKVLIVDDSVVFRMSISEGLKDVAGLEVAGTASNGQVALDFLKKNQDVDLMILDMEMPVMDGITTIEEVRKLNKKVIIIVFSSLTLNGAELTMKALELGANDFVTKQEASSAVNLEESLKMIQQTLVPKIKAFESIIRKGRLTQPGAERSSPSPTTTPESSTPKREPTPVENQEVPRSKAMGVSDLLNMMPVTPKMLLLASSTGGPDALSFLFKNLTEPVKVPILLVQHMPPLFTEKLADMLNSFTPHVEIKEAKDGDQVKPGLCLIAPGDYHMTLDKNGFVRMNQDDKVSFVRPSATVLFESVYQNYSEKTLSIVFTGMGDDGAQGLKGLKSRGDYILIQDEESSVVWGMPGAVKNTFPDVNELSLDDIPVFINHLLKRMT